MAIDGGHYIEPEKLASFLREKLRWAESRGLAHCIPIWPGSPNEQEEVRKIWRRRNCVIIECVLPEVDGDRWAINEIYWEELKQIGEHLDFCKTGLMCGRSRWLIGREQSKS